MHATAVLPSFVTVDVRDLTAVSCNQIKVLIEDKLRKVCSTYFKGFATYALGHQLSQLLQVLDTQIRECGYDFS